MRRSEFVGIVGGITWLAAGGKPARMPAKSALRALLDGNERYFSGQPIHTEHTARREELSGGQHPFAIVLSCSDSRVPPEIVFDQGLGDLFVIRIAGNYAEHGGIGSIEYAVLHFGCPLLVVLGHSGCGAVHATVEVMEERAKPPPGSIATIVQALMPAARLARDEHGDLETNAIRENVRLNVTNLSREPILAEAVHHERLRIVGAVYDLKSGRVHVID